jgi:protein gp37
MNVTGISWTEQTWNPVSGCVKVSPGCKHCYAEGIAEKHRGSAAFPNGFDLTLRPHKLREPFKLKVPSMIFVNSMSDLFWDQIPEAYRDQVVDVIEATPQHEYQVLTKRAEALWRYSTRRPLPRNFWAGVSAEDQTSLAARGGILREVKAEIRFLSLEPALEDMDLHPILEGGKIQWVIWGGESGLHLMREDVREKRGAAIPLATGGWGPRPDRIAWARHARDACTAHGVPFFFKQWGGSRSHSAGNLLDGRVWEQFPRAPRAPQQLTG